MFRIESESDGRTTRLRLSGRIQAAQLCDIRQHMKGSGKTFVLDLGQVTLVDLDVVRFLSHCEDQSIELVNCPSYIREWILRERGAQ